MTELNKEMTQLTLAEKAQMAMSSRDNGAKLTALAESTKYITAVTNKDGREQCHRAYMVAKNIRIDIANIGKAARDEANKFSQEVLAEERRLIGIIEPEETRLKELRDTFDKKEAEEKAAKKAEEEKRIADIKAKIKAIDDMVVSASLKQFSADVKEILANVESIVIDDSFAEFYGEANEARGKAKQTLNAIILAKETAEQVAYETAERNRQMEEQLAELRRQNEELAKNQAPKAEEAPAILPIEATVCSPVVPFIEHATGAVAINSTSNGIVSRTRTDAEKKASNRIEAFLEFIECQSEKVDEYRELLTKFTNFTDKE